MCNDSCTIQCQSNEPDDGSKIARRSVHAGQRIGFMYIDNHGMNGDSSEVEVYYC